MRVRGGSEQQHHGLVAAGLDQMLGGVRRADAAAEHGDASVSRAEPPMTGLDLRLDLLRAVVDGAAERADLDEVCATKPCQLGYDVGRHGRPFAAAPVGSTDAVGEDRDAEFLVAKDSKRIEPL